MLDVEFPGYSWAFKTALTVAEARRFLSNSLTSRMSMFIQGASSPGDLLGGVYAWVPGSYAVDDGKNVIRPDDVTATAPGRWLVCAVAPEGPVGPEGVPGPEGPAGPSADLDSFDPGDLTVFFDENLV